MCGSDPRALTLGSRLVESILRFGLLNESYDESLHLHFITDGGRSSLRLLEHTTSRIAALGQSERVFLHWHSLATPSGILGFPHLFKLCSVNRLALPDALPGIDRVIYIDLDSVVLEPLRTLYDHFDNFTGQQAVGAVLEHDRGEGGGYVDRRREQEGTCTKFAPFYGTTGVNAGTLLLDLTKLRAQRFTERVRAVISAEHKTAPDGRCDLPFAPVAFEFPMGDQCILNYFLAAEPGTVYVLPPTWNWRFGDSDLGVWSRPPHRPALFHSARLFWVGTPEARWWVPPGELPMAEWVDRAVFDRLDRLAMDIEDAHHEQPEPRTRDRSREEL